VAGADDGPEGTPDEPSSDEGPVRQ